MGTRIKKAKNAIKNWAIENGPYLLLTAAGVAAIVLTVQKYEKADHDSYVEYLETRLDMTAIELGWNVREHRPRLIDTQRPDQ